MTDKIFGLLGMAKKAGKLTVGIPALQEYRFRNKPSMIIIASDAAGNTKNKVKAHFDNKIEPIIVPYTKQELGHCVSYNEAAVIGILDKGFANAISRLIENGGK